MAFAEVRVIHATLLMRRTRDRSGTASSTGSRVSAALSLQSTTSDSHVHDAKTVLAKLDPRFYTEHFDPVQHLLDTMPDSQEAAVAALMQQQVDYDVAKDAIQTRLSRAVMNNYTKFIDGMKFVQEVDMDISRAEIAVMNTLRKLRGAKEESVSNALRIIHRRRKRERVVDVMTRLKWIKGVVGVEDAVKASFAAKEYANCVAQVVKARRKLASSRAAPYAVLKPLRARLDVALPSLCDQFDGEFARMIAEGFNAVEYDGLIRAYHSLDREGVPTGSTLSSAVGADGVLRAEAGRDRRLSEPGADLVAAVTEGQQADKKDGHLPTLPSRLQVAVLLAIKKRTKGALVDLLIKLEQMRVIEPDASIQAALGSDRRHSVAARRASEAHGADPSLPAAGAGSSAAAEPAANGTAPPSTAAAEGATAAKPPPPPPMQAPSDDEVDQARLARQAEMMHMQPFAELCTRVPAEHLVDAANCVMHTHYLVLQWHRCPLDDRNHSKSFLKRCGIDDRQPAGERKAPENAEDLEAYSMLITGVHKEMLDTRQVVWHAIQQRLKQLFFAVFEAHTTSINAAFLTGALSVAYRLMKVGEEYSRSDSNTLTSSLHLLCTRHVDETSREALESLCSSLAKEPWHRVPVSPEIIGTVISGLTTSSAAMNDMVVAEAGAAIGDYTRLRLLDGQSTRAPDSPSVSSPSSRATTAYLQTYSSADDPFKAAVLVSTGGASGRASAAAGGAAATADEEEEEEEEEEVVDDDADDDDDDDKPTPSRRIRDLRVDNGSSLSPMASPSPSGLESTPFIVTTSALNGLARHTQRYFSLMHALPPVAPTAFHGLIRLFNVYWYTVATLFVPNEALSALFSHFAAVESSSASPDGGSPATPSSLVDNPNTFPFLDSTALPVADFVSKELRESHETSVADRLSSARRLLSRTKGEAAGASEDGPGDGGELPKPRRGLEYHVLHSLLSEIRDEVEAGRIGANVQGELPPASMGMHRTPLSFIPLQPMVDLASESNVFGLAERCVAVESLEFVLATLETIKEQLLTSVLPPSYHRSIRQFYAKAGAAVLQLRGFMYMAMVRQVMPEALRIPEWMNSVRWDAVRECMDPSPYIAKILEPLQRAGAVLKAAAEDTLPGRSRAAIWGCLVGHIMYCFVEGVSRVRRSSTAGRGLMVVDVTAVFSQASRLGPLRAGTIVRDKTWADSFIKAYYYEAEGDALQWVLAHKDEYSSRHMKAYISNGVGANAKKKKLKDLLGCVDTVYTTGVLDMAALE